jgi:hypothetical protein
MTDEDIQDYQTVCGDYAQPDNGLTPMWVEFSQQEMRLIRGVCLNLGVDPRAFARLSTVCYARQVNNQQYDR